VSALEDAFAGLRGEAKRDHAASEVDHGGGNENAADREYPDFFMELRGGACVTVSLTLSERTASADWGEPLPRLDSKATPVVRQIQYIGKSQILLLRWYCTCLILKLNKTGRARR
jgi:hypothetical protein